MNTIHVHSNSVFGVCNGYDSMNVLSDLCTRFIFGAPIQLIHHISLMNYIFQRVAGTTHIPGAVLSRCFNVSVSIFLGFLAICMIKDVRCFQ